MKRDGRDGDGDGDGHVTDSALDASMAAPGGGKMIDEWRAVGGIPISGQWMTELEPRQHDGPLRG